MFREYFDSALWVKKKKEKEKHRGDGPKQTVLHLCSMSNPESINRNPILPTPTEVTLGWVQLHTCALMTIYDEARGQPNSPNTENLTVCIVVSNLRNSITKIMLIKFLCIYQDKDKSQSMAAYVMIQYTQRWNVLLQFRLGILKISLSAMCITSLFYCSAIIKVLTCTLSVTVRDSLLQTVEFRVTMKCKCYRKWTQIWLWDISQLSPFINQVFALVQNYTCTTLHFIMHW